MKIIFGFLKEHFEDRLLVVRYIIVGLISIGTNLFFIYLITEVFKVWYIYSSVISYVIAFMTSFLLQKLWTFKDSSWERGHMQAFSYSIIALVTFVSNITILYVLTEYLNIWYLASQIVSLGIVAFMSFLLNKTFTFNTTTLSYENSHSDSESR